LVRLHARRGCRWGAHQLAGGRSLRGSRRPCRRAGQLLRRSQADRGNRQASARVAGLPGLDPRPQTVMAGTEKTKFQSMPPGPPLPRALQTLGFIFMPARTLGVIMRAVFGLDEGPRQEELKRRVRAMIDPVGTRLGIMLMALSSGRLGASRFEAFEQRRAAVDELIFDEIARRRSDKSL